MGAGFGPEMKAKEQDEMESYIPLKYNHKTRLSVEITSGTNEHDFSLEP